MCGACHSFFRVHLLSASLLFMLGFEYRKHRDEARKISLRARRRRVSIRYWITLSVTAILSAIHLANSVRRQWWSDGALLLENEVLFSFSQFVVWVVFTGMVVYEKAFSLEIHSMGVRVGWAANFVVGLVTVGWGLVQWKNSAFVSDHELAVDTFLALCATVPASLFLVLVAWSGKTGIIIISSFGNGSSSSASSDLLKPLISANGAVKSEESEHGNAAGAQEGGLDASSIAGGYGEAGFLSKLTFYWLNHLLDVGSKKTLQLVDIPLLPEEVRVKSAHAIFASNFQSNDSSRPRKSILLALFRSFWPLFIITALNGLLRISVMYAGPLLIQSFIDITAKEESHWLEGAILVAELLVAKIVEAVYEHQFTFLARKLSLLVRESLVSAVYQKGLRISNTSRQAHGVGKIVNYMNVDTQECANTADQVHDLWMLPLQVLIALAILYKVVGVATFAGVATMGIVMVGTFLLARIRRAYQQKLMLAKDKRMKVTTEALSNMKVIKLSSWQEKFLLRVEDARAEERGWLSRVMYFTAMSIFLLWLSPLLVSVFTFATCILLKIELTPGRVFTAIATFRILQEPLRSFPSTIMSVYQAMVSVKRLEDYLQSPELDPEAVERKPTGGIDNSNAAVVGRNGNFKWESEVENLTLKNINVEVARGSLLAIVGLVGSGKSGLLACVLGEMEKVSGHVSVSGSVAYVAQSPWIQNCSIQANILCGSPLDILRYQETLRVCALEGDLVQMVSGDQTEIGERGINLSGGQKQRIQLARAVYHDADVYLLDDVFSAVDAHTATELFRECIRETLKKKTVLLVTHQVEFLHIADQILVMRNGEIVQSGKYKELVALGTDFGALVAAHNKSLDDSAAEAAAAGDKNRVSSAIEESDDNSPLNFEGNETESEESPSEFDQASTIAILNRLELGPSSPRLLMSSSPRGTFDGPGSPKLSHDKSLEKSKSLKKAPVVAKASTPPSSRLIEEEERAEGRVGWPVYWAYATKVLYGTHIIVLILIQTAWQSLQIASDFWLARSTSSEEDFRPATFITVYSELAMGSGIFVLARALMIAFAGLGTAQRFFSDMLRAIFRAPMSFFDTTPSGRILTRSSTDQMGLDMYFPHLLGSLLANGFQLLGVLVVMSGITWQVGIAIIPLLAVFIRYQIYFIATMRELSRLESVTQAPVVHHFSETIAGLATIRAFEQQQRFTTVNEDLVDRNIRIELYLFASYDWLGIRLSAIGAVLLAISSLLLVSLPRNVVQPELVGLSLSYGLALSSCLYAVIICISYVEEGMISTERILQYTNIPSEAPLVIDSNRPRTTWPNHGTIRFENLQLRYRADTPLVLKGITFFVQGGEKLGVVGRTGSGKSSLVQALFRLVEPAAGKIVIDGVDISTIGLSDLRSRMSIIPQEPTLVEGTIRSNMDPLGEFSDAQIWEALEKCQLAQVVREKEDKLDSKVAENGENWSMGQRQLVCIGRTLLKRCQIVVLDEATASVDTQTDAVIQKIIAQEFNHCTIFSIAHRIPSVMDSDKVLVLDAGRVAEFGSPSSLLENPSSLFSSLVQEYWNRSINQDY